MAEDNALSLGDQATFARGVNSADTDSLGDELTTPGAAPTLDGVAFNDGIEIVDLTARYTIEGVLARGGMGEVLLATDLRLKRRVAIKRILDKIGHTEIAMRRFLTEAQSLAALSHFNIVQVYDYGRDRDGPFLIMEFVDGNNLADRCRNGALPVEEAVKLTCQLCDGLENSHDAGIIHRDIKPANVLLTKEGIPKLTDFGLARQDAGDAGHTLTGAVLGTLDFMPPEQRKDAAFTDARSDLWSLAATLYQLLTGEPPRVIDLDTVPQQLRQTLSKALKSKKEDRYQTAREFREALLACLQPSGPALQTDAELGTGECPKCHTKNESSRKFCRECAASLRVSCLKCNVEIPVWEKVCGDCGGKQADLVAERRSKMASRQEQAVTRLKQHDYVGATKLATALRDEPDLRLQQLKDWAEKFLQEVDHSREQQFQRMSELLNEAQQHEQAYDYQAAIHTLGSVPEFLLDETLPGHSSTIFAVLSRLQTKQTESQNLDKLIRQRIATRQLNGLLSEVDALLTIRPDREDLAKLREQLIARDQKLTVIRDTAFAEGQRLFELQDYEGCRLELAKIDRSLRRPDIMHLWKQAQTMRDRLAELRPLILSPLSRARLHHVDECLSLKGNDPELQKLRERLVEDQNEREQLVERDRQNGRERMAERHRQDMRRRRYYAIIFFGAAAAIVALLIWAGHSGVAVAVVILLICLFFWLGYSD